MRNQQAIDGKWSYIEFLSRLLEDEVQRRHQKQLALRLGRATLNTTKTLESFAFNASINRQQLLQLASGEYRCTVEPTSTYYARECSPIRSGAEMRLHQKLGRAIF